MKPLPPSFLDVYDSVRRYVPQEGTVAPDVPDETFSLMAKVVEAAKSVQLRDMCLHVHQPVSAASVAEMLYRLKVEETVAEAGGFSDGTELNDPLRDEDRLSDDHLRTRLGDAYGIDASALRINEGLTLKDLASQVAKLGIEAGWLALAARAGLATGKEVSEVAELRVPGIGRETLTGKPNPDIDLIGDVTDRLLNDKD